MCIRCLKEGDDYCIPSYFDPNKKLRKTKRIKQPDQIEFPLINDVEGTEPIVLTVAASADASKVLEHLPKLIHQKSKREPNTSLIDDNNNFYPSSHSAIANLEAKISTATGENVHPKSHLVEIVVTSDQPIRVPEDIATSILVPSSATNNNNHNSNDDLATRNGISSLECLQINNESSNVELESNINHATYATEDKKYLKWLSSTKEITYNGTLLLTAVTVVSILVVFSSFKRTR
eukprot:gene27963-36833_t